MGPTTAHPHVLSVGKLCLLEIWHVSSTVPNMLANILSKTKAISFSGCFLQFSISLFPGHSWMSLLAVMAYDRYQAICHPLHYPIIMTPGGSVEHWYLCWLTGFLGYPIPIFFISQLSFCGPNTIDHFLCDMDPLMALSCAPAPITEFIFILRVPFVLFFTITYILRSYTLLLRAVFQIPSTAGRRKAFF